MESTQIASVKNIHGKISFYVFVSLFAFAVLAIILAVFSGGRGHPPAAVFLAFAAVLLFCIGSPIGIIFGLFGISRHPRKHAIIGIIGNAFFALFALIIYASSSF